MQYLQTLKAEKANKKDVEEDDNDDEDDVDESDKSDELDESDDSSDNEPFIHVGNFEKPFVVDVPHLVFLLWRHNPGRNIDVSVSCFWISYLLF